MEKQRINQILFGTVVLLMAVFALVLTLGLALTPAGGGTVHSPWLGDYHMASLRPHSALGNAMLWLLMPVPFICALEGALWRFSEARRMEEEAADYGPEKVRRTLGKARLFGSIGNSLFFALLFLAADIVAVHEALIAPKAFSINIVWYAVTAAVYLVFRRRIKDAFGLLGKRLRRGKPVYELVPGGVRITLFPVWTNREPAPEPVTLLFDELTELTELTYAEAESLLKYQTGVDLDLPVRQSRDYARYARREIPRPSVYTFGVPSTGRGSRVFFQGEDIFYLLEFDADDVADLIDAFTACKARRADA